MKTPKISVIVPVYQTEVYLRECVDSLLGQTYKSIEIILVDDGSTDDCPAICDAYAEKDERVRVIHKANAGVAAARNTGLDAVSGAYIAFADSDDVAMPAMLEKLAEASLSSQAEIATCGYKMIGEKETLKSVGASRVEKPENLLKEILLDRGNAAVLWNKLFAADLFEGVRFPEGEIHEDFAVLCRLIGSAERIACIDYIGYCYRKREGSLLDSGYSTAMMRQQFRDIRIWRDYLKEHYPGLLPALKDYTAEQYLRMASLYLQSGRSTDTAEYKWLKKGVMRSFRRILARRNLGADKKIKALLIINGIYAPLRKGYRLLRD